jgi:enamine deaminase RidA (YjgF/YER057c/UK114 family)
MRRSRRKRSRSSRAGSIVMMSRFTEKAQESLQRAQQIMFAKQHMQLDVEHILLSLLQGHNSLTAHIISRLGSDPQAMTQQLEMSLNNMQSNRTATATGYITLRCNKVLQGAAEEADRLNDNFISVEHILLAISGEHGGASGKLLQEAGIDREKIYDVIRALRDVSSAKARVSQPAWVTTIEDIELSNTIINPPSLARPRGFNHGILTNSRHNLFLAGQTALDAEGKIVASGDIVAQYRQVLSNLKAVVEAAGGAMEDIVKITIFVKDRDDYKAHLKPLGQVHKEFFGSYYPATALLEISRFFDDDALVEIEGIAVLGE